MCKSWKLDLVLCTVPKSRGDIRMMMRRYIWGPIRESTTIVTSSTSQSWRWRSESHVTATVCPLRETGTGSSELQALKWAGVGHRGRTSLLLHRQWTAGSMTCRDEAAVQTAPLRHADWKGHRRSVQRSYCHWLSPRTGLAEYMDSRVGSTYTHLEKEFERLQSSSVLEYHCTCAWEVKCACRAPSDEGQGPATACRRYCSVATRWARWEAHWWPYGKGTYRSNLASEVSSVGGTSMLHV